MYDLVVIGAGSGGLHAVKAAARVGAKVALIDRHQPGGDGLYEACVPSKGLVQAARLLRQIRRAHEFGIETGPPRVDLAAALARIRQVAAESAAAFADDVLRSQGIDVYHGTATFEAYDTVLLDGVQRIEGQRFVVATGSRPARPDIPGLSEAGYLDSTTVWSHSSVPESLIVIGGGQVGLEFAQVFARFGSRVTVLTEEDRVLPREDEEISGHVACMLTGEGITIKRRLKIEQVESRGQEKVCVIVDEAGQRTQESAAEILYAAKRLANIEGLNLSTLGVHGDAEHGIEVDDQLQTHASRVFAIGDVLLRNQYSHAAEREADTVFQNAVLHRRKKIDYNTLPWATFLDPEVATVGISEAQAKAENLEHHVFRASYAQNDRARLEGRTEGFAKVVATRSGKILGATILGEEASLVLQQLVVAMDAGIGLGELAETTQIYPTYAQLISDLAGQFQATWLQRGFLASARKLLYGYQPRLVGAGSSAVEAISHGGHSGETESQTHTEPHSEGASRGHAH
ncbi:MAG: FAD-dependent oxidoreductase [Planctomycetaceae bacterium]|nr:FAD-dependent oxidoreductase [Planctomycetaceae bacterium]